MKPLLLLIACSFASLLATAQTTVYSTDFESTTGWTSVDTDGDGIEWGQTNTYSNNGFSAGNAVISYSYATTPDNLLVSPAITVPSSGTTTLTYKVGSFTFDAENYYAEHYAVYVLAATASFTGTETALKEETLTSYQAKDVPVDISSFAGQAVKVYFRHYNCTDQYAIILDDVSVTNSQLSGLGGLSEGDPAVAVYPNPATGRVTVSVPVGGSLRKVEVTGLDGRLVQSVPASGASASMDVSPLPGGVYVVKVVSDKGTSTGKLVKK